MKLEKDTMNEILEMLTAGYGTLLNEAYSDYFDGEITLKEYEKRTASIHFTFATTVEELVKSTH